LLLAAALDVSATVFTTTFPVQGTAVNATNVIGGGSHTAVGIDKLTGTRDGLFGSSGTIDAGQYNDAVTMYLNSSGTLSLIRNSDGNNLQNYNVGDAFGVSGVINVGGNPYAILAGHTSGVRALNLSTGVRTTLGSVTNYDFTDVTGLDVFMRPGGNSLDDIAVALVRDWPMLDIYTNGFLASSIEPSVNSGVINDLSFDLTSNTVWFGTERTPISGRLFDAPFDFSTYAVAPPTVSVNVTNGIVVVDWTGRTLEASSTLTNWLPVATAPATPTQFLPPPPHTEPATNPARYFRSRW
jgi:hypothetical protein